MFRTIVVKFCELASDLLEPLRSGWANRAYWFFVELRATTLMKQRGLDPSVPECSCWYCLAGEKHPEEPGAKRVEFVGIGLGMPRGWPYSGKCGCDRPRWNVRPCGHCTCRSECDDCWANKLWRCELESWCGCARPGEKGVLECGHCACGYGCFEVVRNGSHAAPRKAPCVT